jgi:hypothetical protein
MTLTHAYKLATAAGFSEGAGGVSEVAGSDFATDYGAGDECPKCAAALSVRIAVFESTVLIGRRLLI